MRAIHRQTEEGLFRYWSLGIFPSSTERSWAARVCTSATSRCWYLDVQTFRPNEVHTFLSTEQRGEGAALANRQEEVQVFLNCIAGVGAGIPELSVAFADIHKYVVRRRCMY